MGELTDAGGLGGNAPPGSTPGFVGPRPLTYAYSFSPGAAGFDAVTISLFACATRGVPPVVRTIGRFIGVTWNTHRARPPPLRRRLAGSSTIDAIRTATVCAVTDCP